jgi:hypothetical protein
MMGKRWTDQDIDNLKRMAKRYSAPKIAEMIDRTVGGVTFKANQLKLSLRPSRETEGKSGLVDAGPAGFDWQ